MAARGVVIDPDQAFVLRWRYGVERWAADRGPITGSIGVLDGLPIVELAWGVPAPSGWVDLRPDEEALKNRRNPDG